MTEETIFNKEGTQTPSEQQQTTVTTPAIPQELVDWVGPGKKYASIEEVYKAFPNAQQHIETQSEKIRQLEEELNKRKSAEDVLNEIRNNSTNIQKLPSQGVEVNESVLSSIVERKLKEHVTIQKQEQNLDEVVDAFSNSFGDKKEEVYKQLAAENGLTLQELNQLSAKSPKMVLKLAGIGEKSKTTSTNINSSINTQSFMNNNTQQTVETSKVNHNPSSKDLADGWRRAREIVNKKLQG